MVMKKKRILAIVYILIVILVFFLWLSYAKRPQNVFDQIHYELKKVERKKDSVLVSGTESAEAKYDRNLFTFEFTGIHIPDLEVFLSEYDGYLHITFWRLSETGQDDSIHFVYNPKTEKLYGEQPMQYLCDHFLTQYFQWWEDAGQENDYSYTNLGEFLFIETDNASAANALDNLDAS